MTPTEKDVFESILRVYVGKEFHQECREKMDTATETDEWNEQIEYRNEIYPETE